MLFGISPWHCAYQKRHVDLEVIGCHAWQRLFRLGGCPVLGLRALSSSEPLLVAVGRIAAEEEVPCPCPALLVPLAGRSRHAFAETAMSASICRWRRSRPLLGTLLVRPSSSMHVPWGAISEAPLTKLSHQASQASHSKTKLIKLNWEVEGDLRPL